MNNMMLKMKKIEIIMAVVFSAVLIVQGCTKKSDNLYSISVSPSAMVGTPAEKFSLQQIKMFQASNNFACTTLARAVQDTACRNLAFAPLYLVNTVMCDTSLQAWSGAYCSNYNLTFLNPQQLNIAMQSLQNNVKEIDSLMDIKSSVVDSSDSLLTVLQTLKIKLMYKDAAPDDVDNIFTSSDNSKPRLNFFTVSDEIRTYISSREQAAEIPVGNGNYMLMLVKPLEQNIADYTADFDEEKYLTLINAMQERKVKVSLPLFEINDTVRNLVMPSFSTEDSTVNFPKRLNVITQFAVTNADMTELSEQLTVNAANNIMQNNQSAPLKYNSPFLFIVRGKSSNFIMFAGIFAMP